VWREEDERIDNNILLYIDRYLNNFTKVNVGLTSRDVAIFIKNEPIVSSPLLQPKVLYWFFFLKSLSLINYYYYCVKHIAALL
jgi:hypothetical protein